MNNFYLVADLGGTNIRFGLCQPGTTNVKNVRKYGIRDYESITHLIKVYLSATQTDSEIVCGCCIAVAGPIVGERVKMTNCDWEVRTHTINQALQIKNTVLINDFHAIALSASHLSAEGLETIGNQNIFFDRQPISIFGPGTGLGAALLIPDNRNDWIVIPTEGGHAGLSARTEEELFIFDYWRNKGCRINREFFVSGAGIERIFEALCVEQGKEDYKHLTVNTIQVKACQTSDSLCARALNIFCSFLGSAAGDQALCTGSKGGVVLAGGILPRFVSFLQQSPFRQRFESKGVMSDYNKDIGTALIVENQPGLIGAAAYLNRLAKPLD
jgi:glucokinase